MASTIKKPVKKRQKGLSGMAPTAKSQAPSNPIPVGDVLGAIQSVEAVEQLSKKRLKTSVKADNPDEKGDGEGEG